MAFKMKYKNVGELLEASGFKANLDIVAKGLNKAAGSIASVINPEIESDDDDDGDDDDVFIRKKKKKE